MKIERIQITYELAFTSAFHFGTGLRGGLVHRLVARDANGFLYVPGSTLKGVLRERCEQLAHVFNLQTTLPHTEDWREADQSMPDIVTRIFGSRFLPGHLYFDDAQMSEPTRALFEVETESLKPKFKAWQVERRTQVSLSRATRTARSGLLFTSEYGVRDLRFKGQIMGTLTGTPLFDSTVGTFPLLLLVAGLLSLDHIGGNKSSGAGKLTCEIFDRQISVDDNSLTVETLLEELPYFGLYEEWREEAAG